MLALPAISTGIHGFPVQRAAEIAVGMMRAHVEQTSLQRVLLVCFSEEAIRAYERALG